MKHLYIHFQDILNDFLNVKILKENVFSHHSMYLTVYTVWFLSEVFGYLPLRFLVDVFTCFVYVYPDNISIPLLLTTTVAFKGHVLRLQPPHCLCIADIV